MSKHEVGLQARLSYEMKNFVVTLAEVGHKD
jgi:hypothetical protein